MDDQIRDFSFAMNVAKSFTTEATADTPSKMIIKGVASNTQRDKQGERFSIEGLHNIKKAIEDGIVDEDGDWSYVPLRSGHRQEWDDVLGWVVGAEIDENENLWITAELDEDSEGARTLYRKVSKGNANGRRSKLGLSVKGKTTKYTLTFDQELRRTVPTLHNLLINEISVTGKPVNPTPYGLAIAKSLLAENMEDAMSDKQEAEATVEEVVEHEEREPAAIADGAADVEITHTADTAAELAEERGEGADKIVVSENEVSSNDDNPTQASETQEANTQEVTETQPETADPVAGLQATLQSIADAVNGLKAEVENLQQARETQKALPDEVTEPATLEVAAEENNIQTIVELAVAKAFENLGDRLGLKAIADEINVVKSSIATLSEQPNDRSISVRKAKDEHDEDDPYVRMQALKQSGLDPLAASFMAAYPNSSNKK